MTIKQKQCLLCYLGYYVGDIDGKFGTLSRIATTAFQKDFGLKADGICGNTTEKALKHAVAYGMPAKNIKEPEKEENEQNKPFWDEIKYFSRNEFKCKCGQFCNGFPVEPNETMVQYADAIRERLGVPLSVNSGIRCNQHNSNVGGVRNSQHVLGTACDLGAPDGITPEKMAQVAEEVIGNTGGIGIYSWGIHIDSRSIKARWNG